MGINGVADFHVRRREMILIVNSDVTVAALRFPRPFGRANRATSSKPARFIRHWRRFADFHVRQKKRISARKRARCAPTAHSECAAADCNPLKREPSAAVLV